MVHYYDLTKEDVLKQTNKLYIYIYIGESDSLANYYYIHASNLNQQAFMHRYNMSIIYICTHAFHASVTNSNSYDNDKT